MIDIKDIKNPDFIKDLSTKELEELASDIRTFMIESVSKTGGHLSSNLSMVELTLVLHKLFDFKKDNIIFDGGYQSYTHKIVTGRINEFDKLRKKDGLSGYFNADESEYDNDNIPFSMGIAVAYGKACARDLSKADNQVVCIVGEESILNGESLEAINQIGKTNTKLIIILNDNGDYRERPNVTKLQKTLNNVRNNQEYLAIKKTIKDTLKRSDTGRNILENVRSFKNNIKNQIINGGIFTGLGLNYIGPIDGHNIAQLIKTINKAKAEEGPVLIHILTKKGRGYPLLENGLKNDRNLSGPFNFKTGKSMISTPIGYATCSDIICTSLETIMNKSAKVVAILCDADCDAAFKNIMAKFPGRIIRCNTHENVAIATAYSLAKDGYRPFVLLDSTYLSHAMSSICDLILRYDVPVVFGLKNAGLLQDEGNDKQGIYDISLLSSFDKLTLVEGYDYKEIMNLFFLGFMQKNAYFIRIPNNNILISNENSKVLEFGTWNYLRKLDKYEATIISYGKDLEILLKEVTINDLPYQIVNARFINPLDVKLLEELIKEGKKIVVYNTDYYENALYDKILKTIRSDIKLYNMAIKSPVCVGSIGQIKEAQNLKWVHINEVLKSND